MTAEYGAATQLEKIDMLDFADVIAINKFDKRGSLDALRDVRKQWQRNHNAFDDRRRRAPGLRHDRVAVQRPGHEPALPRADGRRSPRSTGAPLAFALRAHGRR